MTIPSCESGIRVSLRVICLASSLSVVECETRLPRRGGAACASSSAIISETSAFSQGGEDAFDCHACSPRVRCLPSTIDNSYLAQRSRWPSRARDRLIVARDGIKARFMQGPSRGFSYQNCPGLTTGRWLHSESHSIRPPDHSFYLGTLSFSYPTVFSCADHSHWWVMANFTNKLRKLAKK